jgi:hypothetical protein
MLSPWKIALKSEGHRKPRDGDGELLRLPVLRWAGVAKVEDAAGLEPVGTLILVERLVPCGFDPRRPHHHHHITPFR